MAKRCMVLLLGRILPQEAERYLKQPHLHWHAHLRAPRLSGRLAGHCARRLRALSRLLSRSGASARGGIPAVRRLSAKGICSMEIDWQKVSADVDARGSAIVE